jgi:hypothetical protein
VKQILPDEDLLKQIICNLKESGIMKIVNEKWIIKE